MSKRKQQAREAARQILAAQRRREAVRKRMMIAGGVVAAVLIALGIVVGVKLSQGSPPAAAAEQTALAPASVLSAVTGVPAATLDAIGKGSGLESLPKKLSGRQVRTADGKPLVLYVGAEYCPFCAAQRWSLVEALSRFGTFSNLGETASSSSDEDPDTPTLSFHGSTYTSPYITFQAVEMYTNQPEGNFYTTLDTPTPQQSQLWSSDGNSSFPFIDLGDQAEVTTVLVDPSILAGLTHQQVADAMSDPTSKIGQAFGGSANAFTTIICGLTGGQPAAVCNSPAAHAYDDTFGATS